ncbi:MAG: hypothetical protein H7Y00_11635 [Fimbriimonadaceae bacterium]|nr:hypothetical protein [Chitinophagales bacterium]
MKWETNADQPIPVASVAFKEKIPDGIELIPVIFITNETLQKINDEEIKTLAFKISKKIGDILQENNLSAVKEIQLDCDWNEKTEKKYFLLVDEMKKFPLWEKTTWSATIRLHQIKYADRTGVPPVDKGMLMFYNMGNIADVSSQNSIYDQETAKQYVAKIDAYPLPLDAAIACFSWGLLFYENKLQRIIYPLYENNLSDSLFTALPGNVFTAKKSFYFEGSFLAEGNTIKIESMTQELSLQSAEILRQYLKNDSMSVILYHLDSTILNYYTNESFENIYSIFE